MIVNNAHGGTGKNLKVGGPVRRKAPEKKFCGRACNVTLYNVDDFISTQIDTQIGYVQSDVYEFSIRRSDRYCYA